jgi:futalosine hydrolase
VTARLLVVTAVEAEAEAVRAGCTTEQPTAVRVDVEAVGVGPAMAGAGTARLLALAEAAGTPYRAVVSAGIGGGFPGRAPVGATVIGVRSVAAELGAETPDGFLPIDGLGFGTSLIRADEALARVLIQALDPALVGALAAEPPGAVADQPIADQPIADQPVVGDILTLSTVTGSAATAAALATRFPTAVAEAMEGYGVACAAAGAAVPFVELRAISNLIGPRDRAAWRIPEALRALTAAARVLPTLITDRDHRP